MKVRHCCLQRVPYAILAQEFKYLAVNEACLKAFGLNQHSDIVGKTTTELVRDPEP